MKGKVFYRVVTVIVLFLLSGCWELDGNSGTNPSKNFLGTKDNQPLNIKTNNSTAMHIDTAGNVGIGTTTPADKLHVVGGHLVVGGGSHGAQRGVVFDHGQPGTTLIVGTAPSLQIRSGAGTRSIDFYGGPAVPLVRITGSGNVGIGATNPQAKLAVSGLPTAPPDTSGSAGMVCVTNDGNFWLDNDGTYDCQ